MKARVNDDKSFVYNDNRYRHNIKFAVFQDNECNFDPKLYAWEDIRYNRFKGKKWEGYSVPPSQRQAVDNHRRHFRELYMQVMDRYNK